jgi:hypothetical protein
MDDQGQVIQDVETAVPEVRFSFFPLVPSTDYQSVVLQNLSYAFTEPNIMDAKLGTVLHEPGATAEKKAKMEKQAKATTTASTGLRLTGCQVSSSQLEIPRLANILDLARTFIDVHVDS